MPLTPGITQPSALLNSLALQTANSRIMPDPETVASPGNTVLLTERTPVLRQLSSMPYGGWDNITQKTVSGTGQIVIPDAMPGPLLGLTVTFDPVQTGTGDPSPENVRPIIPWQSIGLTVNGISISVPLEGSYYGGIADLVNGTVTYEWIKQNADGLSTWYNSAYANIGVFYAQLLTGSNNHHDNNFISNRYMTISSDFSQGEMPDYTIKGNISNGLYVYVRDSRYAGNLTAFRADLDFDIVYEIAVPQTQQFTPVSINLTAGQNTISTTANGVITAVYAAV